MTERFAEAERATDELAKGRSGLYALASRFLELEAVQFSDAQRDSAALSKELDRLETEGKERFGDVFEEMLAALAEKRIADQLRRTISPKDQYRNTAGEIEARDTATRAWQTERERGAPDLRDDAIVIFGDAPVAALSLSDLPDGSIVVGAISPEIAQHLPFKKPGQIVLEHKALDHIENRHGGQIRNAGFKDVRDFVAFVLSHVDAVYQGSTNKSFAIVTKQSRPNGQVVARLEFEDIGGSYRIVTAHPINKKFLKNKSPLWESAHLNHSLEQGTPGAVSGQNDDQLNLTTANQDVKPGSGPRGSVQIHDNNYLINLFKAADLSTLIHETGHIFQAELETLIRAGAADETQTRDYAALNDWLSRFDLEEILRTEYNLRYKQRFENQNFEDLSDFDKEQARALAKKEYFARGFEAYLREGRAPSQELEGVCPGPIHRAGGQ